VACLGLRKAGDLPLNKLTRLWIVETRMLHANTVGKFLYDSFLNRTTRNHFLKQSETQ